MQVEKRKKIGIFSKMPFGEGSAAMSFQICFKGVGFFTIIKGNGVFDTPRSEFCGMRHIAFVMFFKAGFQIFGTADVKVSAGRFIDENVNVMKVCHCCIISCEMSVTGISKPYCPASSASQITPRQSSPGRLRASHFAVPSGFARLRLWLAEAKSRQSRDEDWWW